MFKTIIFFILVALVIIFVLQNTQIVEFQFFAWKVSMSRALLLLGNFLIGFFLGWLSSRIRPKARKTK
ncbi:lipopolysaccharide assembly protein LapA domain-containing protein [Thermodesulfobacteriota bacterium]